jgi:hypothetical protein
VNNSQKVFSYGGGVQSRAILRFIKDGIIEKPDLVIFADTHDEPKEVYQGIKEDQDFCKAMGLELVVVSQGRLSEVDRWGGLFIPAYTVSQATGKKGMLNRQCTQRFKVVPMRRYLRSQGVKSAEMWLGISTDEITRMKPSNVKWLTNKFPLIDAGLSRDDCIKRLSKEGIVPAKSACVFCPYHSASEWAQIKRDPEAWARACEYDELIRDKRPKHGPVFVHASCLPLKQAPVENPDLNGNLFDNECEGYCFL